MKKRNLFLSLVVIIGIIPVVNASHIEEGEECEWVEYPSGITLQNLVVYGSSPNDIFINARDIGAPAAGNTLRWTGGPNWITQRTVTYDLLGLYVLDSTNAWAGRSTGQTPGQEGPEYWNGVSWSFQPETFTIGVTLRDFWAFSTNDVWAVSSGGITQATHRILHYDGITWSDSGISTYPGFSVWGFATDDVYFGGGVTGTATMFKHWDGIGFTDITVPTSNLQILGEIKGTSGTDLWISVGPEIWYYDGTWHNRDIPSGIGVQSGLHAVTSNHAWVATNMGHVLEWVDTEWIDTNVGQTVDISSVWFQDSDLSNVWVSGVGGKIFHLENCHQCQLDIVNLTIPTLFVFIIFLGIVAFIARKMVGG